MDQYLETSSIKYKCLCFSVGGMTFNIRSDIPFKESTFQPKFRKFLVARAGRDVIDINHHYSLPGIYLPGQPIYHKPPWSIYRQDKNWIYLGIYPEPINQEFHRLAVFNKNYTKGDIYSPDDSAFSAGGIDSLTFFPSDQILLARLLADRSGCILHSAGLIINGQGLLFCGHSGVGKSTITRMLMNYGEVLCDDRNIVRRYSEGWRVFGTWSHGDIPEVSSASAPLRAILLLEQAQENCLIQIEDRREIVRRLPFLIVRPLVTADWWERTLDLVGQIAREVPIYRLQFDLSGTVIDALSTLF